MKLYKLAPLAMAVSLALGLTGCNDSDDSVITKAIQKVEFVGFDAPKTDDEIASTYTKAKAKITYSDNTSEERSLAYNALFYNTDKVGGSNYAAAQLYDQEGNPLRDAKGNLAIAETPDANSLIQVDGKLFLVTHFEYDWIDTDKNDLYGRMPMTMNLTSLEQDKTSGKLTATQLKNISFKSVGGLWIPCAGSLSPWNTHLGSEEYEPDARCQTESSYSAACNTTTNATNSLEALTKYGISNPNVYNYGLTCL